MCYINNYLYLITFNNNNIYLKLQNENPMWFCNQNEKSNLILTEKKVEEAFFL